jgi:hypothetical protein
VTVAQDSKAFEAALLGGYRREELEAAFDRVAPASHWKDPIDTYVHAPEVADRVLIDFAVRFFTATVPIFTPVNERDGVYRVRADGYRCGPAGDH